MNLKTATIFFGFLFLFIAFSCRKDNEKLPEDKTLVVSETNITGCKNNTKSSDTGQSVILKAVNGNQLQITFVNVLFNCCTENTASDAIIENGILKVVFYEDPPGLCNCICYYDVDCVIGPMENRKYEIEIFTGSDTPYTKFSFTFSETLDLTFDIQD